MGASNAIIGLDQQAMIGLRAALKKRFVIAANRNPGSTSMDEEPPSLYTIDDWEPNDQSLWDWTSWSLSKEMLQALNSSDWDECTEWLGDGIARMAIFEPSVYERIYREIAHLEEWSLRNRVELRPPNSMHNYGIEMQMLGLDSVLQKFTEQLANPISDHLFPEVVDQGVDHHHAFTVTYGKGFNQKLGFHADDSEVTFNFCLGDSFVGSDLYFQGRRCFQHMQSPHRPHEHIEIEQIPGTCIVHSG